MDKDEQKKFRGVVMEVDGLLGMITNFDNRGKKAASQASDRFKSQGKDIPSLKPMSETLSKIAKSTSSARKAADEILKLGTLAADQKKGASLTFADAKKQTRDLLRKIQPLDDLSADIVSLEQKFYKELGLKTMGGDTNTELTLMVTKHCPMFIKYYTKFKMDVNKL